MSRSLSVSLWCASREHNEGHRGQTSPIGGGKDAIDLERGALPNRAVVTTDNCLSTVALPRSRQSRLSRQKGYLHCYDIPDSIFRTEVTKCRHLIALTRFLLFEIVITGSN